MYIYCFEREGQWFGFNPHTMGVAELAADEARELSEAAKTRPAKAFTNHPADLNATFSSTLSKKLQDAEFFVTAADQGSTVEIASKSIELVLNVAQACNLSCTYCFSNNKVNKRMKFSTAKDAIDDAFNRYERFEKFKLSFFGGEATLNFQLIEEATRYHNEICRARDIDVDYFIISNGTLIDDQMADFFDKFGFEVQVSIDGAPEQHDLYRRDHRGRGTYDKVIKAIETLQKKRNIRLSTSSVITNSNDAAGVHAQLRSYDLESMKLDMVYEFQDLGGGDFDSTSNAFSSKFYREMGEIAQRYVDDVVQFRRPSEYNLRQSILLLWSKQKKARYCPAADARYGVGADGTYYPCGASASLQENALGNVRGGVVTEQVKKFDDKLSVEQKEPCRSCWARPLCLGGCPLTLRNGPEPQHCATRKGMAELAIWSYSEIRRRNPFAFMAILDEAMGKKIEKMVKTTIPAIDSRGEPEVEPTR